MSLPSNRKPLSQIFHLFFEEDPELQGEIIAPNQGCFPREAIGFLFRNGEQCGRISIELPAELFEEFAGKGRPQKKERNVAIACATFLFRYKDGEIGLLKARTRVVDLWSSKGYTGLKTEKHIRDRTNETKSILADARVRIIKFFAAGQAVVFIFERGAEWSVSEGIAAVRGPCWWWIEGNETAEHANLKLMKFEWATSSEQDTFGAELRAAIAGDEMKDFVMWP